MKNNILGGLVIFFVVVACLIMIDDISNTKHQEPTFDTVEVDDSEGTKDLAIIDGEK